jgi:hypothetical protein
MFVLIVIITSLQSMTYFYHFIAYMHFHVSKRQKGGLIDKMSKYQDDTLLRYGAM